MARGGKRPGAGRPPGSPNKATADVRAAIAKLLENSSDKMQEWLDRVAMDSPAKALTIVKDLAEYHIPKLARTEVTGLDGNAINVSVVRYSAPE